jgi:hypothetical protein
LSNPAVQTEIEDDLRRIIGFWKSYGKSKFQEPEISLIFGKYKIVSLMFSLFLTRFKGNFGLFVCTILANFRCRQSKIDLFKKLHGCKSTAFSHLFLRINIYELCEFINKICISWQL